MKIWKKNEGLTLVELIVSITIGSLIMLAAVSVLLLGFRINYQTTESVTKQYTARTVITLLENLAAEGSFDKVERLPDGSWKVGVKAADSVDFSQVLLSYSAGYKTIYTGDYDSDTNKAPILEGVVASYIMWDDRVLTISLEDAEQTYSSSVYCRVKKMNGDGNFTPEDKTPDIRNELEDKNNFLSALISQTGTQGGIIDREAEPKPSISGDANFFSEWYIGGYNANTTAQGWGPDTAWCGCFISWGLSQENVLLAPPEGAPKWYANVDNFMEYCKTLGQDGWVATNENRNYVPEPGDLVFFNMIDEDGDDPSHMGAVMDLVTRNDKTYIKTIEGNSADMVAIREYPIDDPRIIGYGDPWAAQTGTNDQDS